MQRSIACCSALVVLALAVLAYVPSGKSGANPVVYTQVALQSASTTTRTGEPLLNETTPLAKIRKALEEPIEFEVQEAAFNEAIDVLKGKAKVNITFDQATLNAMGLPGVTFRAEKAKLKTVLHQMLSEIRLGYGIVGEAIFISTPEMVIHQQMRQPINVDFDSTPLNAALSRLSKDTGVSILLDWKAAKDVQKTPITLKLDNIALENAVILIADFANFKAVRAGNILFVGDEARAVKIQEAMEAPAAPVMPGMGAPVPLAGLNGFAGIVGFGGGFPGAGIGGGLGGLPPVDPNVAAAQNPFVNLKCDKRPLSGILKKLADTHNVNLVLDHKRGGDKFETPITVNLKNADPLTAFQVLTDLADLGCVPMGQPFQQNLLYVTTKDNAKGLLGEQKQLLKQWQDLFNPATPAKPPEAPAAPVPPPANGV